MGVTLAQGLGRPGPQIRGPPRALRGDPQSGPLSLLLSASVKAGGAERACPSLSSAGRYPLEILCLSTTGFVTAAASRQALSLWAQAPEVSAGPVLSTHLQG